MQKAKMFSCWSQVLAISFIFGFFRMSPAYSGFESLSPDSERHGREASQAEVHEYTSKVEKYFPLRSLGELRVTNARGDIRIEGWSQDKIRLRALMRTQAESEPKAHQKFLSIDFDLKTVGKDVELTVVYGKGMSIEERLRERRNPETFVDLTVFAPSALALRVWATGGSVLVRGWGAALGVRTAQGGIHVESIKKGPVSLLCPDCKITAKNVRGGAIRCMGGKGTIDLQDINGGPIYIESEEGSINADLIQGEQLYVSKSGSIEGRSLSGRIEFHTEQGNVHILNSSGFLSGRSESGSIIGQMRAWQFLDKALLESVQGGVELSLPGSFSGEIDLKSKYGRVSSAFPISPGESDSLLKDQIADQANRAIDRSGKDDFLIASQSSRTGKGGQRIVGIVHEGGELLKLESQNGSVSLLKND